jgi:hypothetical protein
MGLEPMPFRGNLRGILSHINRRAADSRSHLESSATAVNLPRLNLRPQPQASTALDEVDNRPWHVRVPTEICGHAVRMAQAEQRRYSAGVDQVIDVDFPTHPALLSGVRCKRMIV